MLVNVWYYARSLEGLVNGLVLNFFCLRGVLTFALYLFAYTCTTFLVIEFGY